MTKLPGFTSNIICNQLPYTSLPPSLLIQRKPIHISENRLAIESHITNTDTYLANRLSTPLFSIVIAGLIYYKKLAELICDAIESQLDRIDEWYEVGYV